MTLLHVSRIERHKLDDVAVYCPDSPQTRSNGCLKYAKMFGTPVYKEDGVTLLGYNLSRLQDVRAHEAHYGTFPWFTRMDILLGTEDGNCPTCHRSGYGEQRAVYPAREGKLSGDVGHFSDEDIAWAREESARIWQVAQTEPTMMRLVMMRGEGE